MNKEKFLKSLPTFKLASWGETAYTSGNGKYAHFDNKTLSTVIFTIEAINAELSMRDDNPNKVVKKKKK